MKEKGSQLKETLMIKDERGIALLLATVVSALLLLLGLTLTFTSITDFSMSTELINKKIAFHTASAGFNAEKGSVNLTTALAATTNVSQYINYPVPTAGTDAEAYFNRNPIAPLEAMNVDYDNPPTPIGSRAVTGLLTPASGTALAGGGRYWAKITDNDDGDSDMTADSDGTVYFRVLGIQKSSPGQISTYGGTVKNSLAIIEATLKLDGTFNLNGAISIYSQDLICFGGCTDPFEIKGNAAGVFAVDGYDHPGMTLQNLIDGLHIGHTVGGTSAGVSLSYDSPPIDAQLARNETWTGLTVAQKDAITGNTSDYGGDGSITDATQAMRDNPDPDATNMFDANYAVDFVEELRNSAAVIYPPSTVANGVTLGTEAAPQVTYCDGDCEFTGSGAGILVIRGTFRGSKTAFFNYMGLILILDPVPLSSAKEWESQNVRILGGLFSARVAPDGAGGWLWADSGVEIDADTYIYYQKEAINLAMSLTPLKSVAWREITREIEPSY